MAAAGRTPADSILIQRMAQGDQQALELLYDRHVRLVHSVAYGVVQNREAAEEVTLDVFSRAWASAASYDHGQAQVRTWLSRMARNRAIDWLRREKVRPSLHSVTWAEVGHEPQAETIAPEQAVQARVEQEQVRQALATLPPEQQEALALAFFQGYSHSEVAAALAQPLGTVKGRIRAALKSLRTLLADAQERS